MNDLEIAYDLCWNALPLRLIMDIARLLTYNKLIGDRNGIPADYEL